MCSCDLDLWPISPEIGSRDPEVFCLMYVPILKFINILFFEIFALKFADLVSPLLVNRRCHGNHFVLHSLGCLPHVSFQVWTWYDHPVLSYYNFYLDTLRYVVTLNFDLLTLESCHVMPRLCSICVPSLNMIRLSVQELGRLQFSVDRQLKVIIFTFLGGKGGQIPNLIFLTPKRHFLGGNDA